MTERYRYADDVRSRLTALQAVVLVVYVLLVGLATIALFLLA